MTRAMASIVLALSALALGLELLLRLLPVSTATMVADHLGAGIPTVPPHHRWTKATGWDLRNAQTLQANAQGFAARHDFVTHPQAVALIGDSFVEASMLPAPDRLDAQLESRLAGRPVYAMGSPGSSLLDYGHRLRWAVSRFGVREAVIFMEHLDVAQSRCDSGNVTSVCWSAWDDRMVPVAAAEPGALKRVLRHSALAQYVLGQLRLDGATLWANVLHQARPAQGHEVGQRKAVPPPLLSTLPLSDLERTATDRIAGLFFEQLDGLPVRVVLVVDASRIDLNRGDTGSGPARDHFIALARARGLTVVDMAPVFAEHRRRSPLALEVGPYDSHLNALGLSLVAQEAARALGSR
ncbi:MAG: hypothetical protein ACK520_16105 [Inhella sp.]|jgi:hypothetical protein|uniref:hypothetical protein n=2 Tax=Inhella sp. TaxID=1921806 RepID=UPI00260DC4CE|nr:hypothetical protein [Inhella sp.]